MKVTNKYKIRLFFYLSIITVSLGVSFIFFITTIRPVFLRRLQFYGEKAATTIINKAISETFSSEKKYSDIVCLEKNNDGTVSALKTNTIEMNRLRSIIAKELEDELNKKDIQYINIPLGNLLGNELLAGIGPDIKIKIRPLGTLNIDFHDKFEDCGINQSRHTVFIIVTVDIMVIAPQLKTTNKISAKVPVSETVIVGNVPKYLGTSSSVHTTFDE